MWSSNANLVFRPHPNEAKGNQDGDTSGAFSDEEKIYDEFSGDEEEEEQKSNKGIQNEDQEGEKESQDVFYIVHADEDESKEVRVKNWVPKSDNEDSDDSTDGGIVQAMFGKDILAVVTKFKNYYARINFDELSEKSGIHEVPKSDIHEYTVNSEDDDTEEDLEIAVAFATHYITKDLPDKPGTIEFQFGLKKKDQ